MKQALFILLMLLPGLSEAKAGVFPSCKQEWKREEYRYDVKESYDSYYSRLKRDQCEKEWTILVYMAADNDLHPFALWDLYEMEAAFETPDRAGSTLKTDLLVEVDGPKSDDMRRLHIFSGREKYSPKRKEDFQRATLDQVHSPVAGKLDETRRITEQKRLEEFLLWGARNYPAKNYMVIVWGHGQGWKAYPVTKKAESRFLDERSLPDSFPETETSKSFGGIAFRQSSGKWLDIPALRGALATFKKEIGKPVDVYASDSCLMQMLEVAYELGEESRFVVGSTQIQNFLGLPYRRILYELNTGGFNGLRKQNRPSVDGSDEPLLLAKMIPTLMKQSLDPRRGLQGRADKEAQKFMTSSALSSSETRRYLVPALADLSRALGSYLKEDSYRSLDLQFVVQNVPNFEGGAQDLGIFLGYLDLLLIEEREKNGEFTREAARLQQAVAKTKDALNRSVVSYAYGDAYGIDENTRLVGFIPRAVSLWLPVEPREYAARRTEFLASRLYKETRWQMWLDSAFPR